MAENHRLGALLEAFIGQISPPRGRAQSFLAAASVTGSQALLLHYALVDPDSTPSTLAAQLNLSLPSVSQMIERLVRLQLLTRAEDPADRRRKTLAVTPRARRLLGALQAVRAAEFAAGTARLPKATQRELIALLSRAVDELKLGGSRPRQESDDSG